MDSSKGLMQVMPGTFDPLANMVASINYAKVRAGEYVLTPDAVRDISRDPTFDTIMRKAMLGDWVPSAEEEELSFPYPEPPPPPVF